MSLWAIIALYRLPTQYQANMVVCVCVSRVGYQGEVETILLLFQFIENGKYGHSHRKFST